MIQFNLRLLACASLMLFVASALAQAPPAPPDAPRPWEWTWEERVADRFDPDEIRQRWIAYQAKRGEVVSEHDEARPVIDGSRNPELFMPSELFNQLLRTCYLPDPYGAFWRDNRQEHVDRLGLGDDFWQRLASLSAQILDRQDRVRELTDELSQADFGEKQRVAARVDALQAPLCGLRAKALNAARREFGHETFDRFLYEAIEMTQTGDATISDLVRVREGCR